MNRTTLIHSEELEKLNYPASCPFNTSRAAKMRKILDNMNLLGGHGRFEFAPRKATRQELEKFHTHEYLDVLQRGNEGKWFDEALNFGMGTPDCPVFAGMYDYALLASGASITGAELILKGSTDIAFNPSGGYHHAARNRCSGFCYINDIVLAAERFVDAGKRVFFLDLDVHHCDGVQDAFCTRKDVMTMSLHESGKTLFPGTGFEKDIGEGAGKGYSVNIPLPVGTYDGIYLHAIKEVALPLIKAFDPDVLIVEFGMDTLAGDPLAHLHLTNNVYADIVPLLMDFKKPILATGGGGYHVENTARAWALVWSAFCGEQTDEWATFGMGGVMLENTDWAGGLRDRTLISDAGNRSEIDSQVNASINKVKELVFPIHGLRS